jgi:hypothetical protein
MKKFKVDAKKITKKLSISRDYDTNPKNYYPVFLFEPGKDFEHYHISITRKEAEKLRDWLNEYLKDRGKK